MKYTKKYPIHPKPDKQFSGASIFAGGGWLDGPGNTYADSLNLYNNTQQSIKAFEKDNWTKSQDKDWVTYTDPNDAGHNSTFFNHPMPVGKQAKGTLEQEVKPTMAKGTMESEPKPINELMMPSGSYMQKDDFIKRYGEKPWMKATGQKFAFGGFKYPNGGSFYDSSNINTSKPQVNTVPSSYTEQFRGNSSSGMTKDGKLPGGSFSSSPSNYQSTANAITQYGTAAANVAGQITSSTLDTSYKNPESDKFATADTVMSNIPVVGQFYGLGNAANAPLKDWQSDSTKRGGATSGEAKAASTISGMVDPMDGWKQNVASYEAGNISKDEAIGNLVAQFFLPGFANNSVNQANEEARKRDQLNTSLSNAQGVDSTARNFQAFGGYKNKFPYGGNMKSEVTGQSYLKDQVSDFTSNKFSKHEQGGVMVDSQNEVEAGEIIYKDYVFSERLKDSNGKSFAERAKKLISQIK